MDMITLPSIIAISAKLVVIVLGRRSLQKTNAAFLLFLAGLCGVNICELSLFFYTENVSAALPILRTYYVFALLACGSLLYFSLQIAEVRTSGALRHLVTAVYSALLIVAALPDVGISGAESIGYSVTRKAGPLYFLIQIGLVGGLTLVLLSLGKASLSTNSRIKQRGVVLLASLSAPASAVIFVVVSMQIGAHFNATVIVSIATSIMMAMLMYTQEEHRLFKFLSLIPSTQENRDLRRAMALINNSDLSLKEAEAAFSDIVVRRAIQAANEDNNKAAERLQISMPTLYRRLKSSKTLTR